MSTSPINTKRGRGGQGKDIYKKINGDYRKEPKKDETKATPTVSLGPIAKS